MTKTREQIDAEKAQKPRPDLIPGSALLAVGEALAYGYRKHGRCTWTVQGTEQAKSETHIASAFRHMAQIGELDESGLPHLHHAAAQLLIAIDCAKRENEAAAVAEWERPSRWPSQWRWAPEITAELPEGWRWIRDESDPDMPYGAARGRLLRWDRTIEAVQARVARWPA